MNKDNMPLTRTGYENLKEEIKRLKFADRPAIIADLKAARALGDLSENAEYQTARQQQAQIDEKIQKLENALNQARVVDLPKGPLNKVVFGSYVVLEDLDEENEKNKYKLYHIVGDLESDLKSQKISIHSPLGRKLINKQVKEEIFLQLPKGEREYLILSIHTSKPEAEKSLNSYHDKVSN